MNALLSTAPTERTIRIAPDHRASPRRSGRDAEWIEPRRSYRLADALQAALRSGGPSLDDLLLVGPADRRDELAALATIVELHLGPVDDLAGPVVHQHHPAVAALAMRLEARYLGRVRAASAALEVDRSDDPVEAMRRLAALDRVPDVYRWIAEEAPLDQIVRFIALEGGPDSGFDDLVAIAQVGLGGEPKLEMAANYADEMGRGDADRVHTTLHQRMVRALAVPTPAPDEQPVSGLERSLLCGVLATRRHLQGHLVGALGMTELQAGPRCRKVADGLRRTGAPAAALAFYDEHAEADPRHGKDWLDHVVAPLARRPGWAAAMAEGACWRTALNARFFAELSAEASTDTVRSGLQGPPGLRRRR